ncbi:hypothetical protein QVD17_30456 [Tagetes erecta]|uniref:Uncharacterized protein n=1 Tax=Tagetes erecta TaxID=13708 RepID=A0AAD8NN95_TARER|nr:hypothetical protein QVD17_30456 [Tagetes erecta]
MHAADLIHEASNAISLGTRIQIMQDIKYAVHAHPTLSEVIDELFKSAKVRGKASIVPQLRSSLLLQWVMSVTWLRIHRKILAGYTTKSERSMPHGEEMVEKQRRVTRSPRVLSSKSGDSNEKVHVATRIPDIQGPFLNKIYLMTLQFLSKTIQLHKIVSQIPQNPLQRI